MSIPQERILQLAGLDAYMLLRYIRLCLKVRSSVHPFRGRFRPIKFALHH